MQEWEYKTIFRKRGWDHVNKKSAFMESTAWSEDPDKFLPQLGKEGWELVAISSRSGILGGVGTANAYGGTIYDYAGFTNEELWVFKRLKS